jgi:rhodanese-related sulfurtransferase
MFIPQFWRFLLKKNLLQWCGYCLVLVLLAGGCANREQAGESSSAKEPASQAATNSYSGKIVALSMRAKTLFITVGSGANAQTVVVKFDDATKGIDEIVEGHFATIHSELRGGETHAISVQPNKAILPEGIADIDTDELTRLMKERDSFVLVDPRPEARYKQSHLPGAVSIPFQSAEQQQVELLPRNKDTLLVFYDGGHGRGTAITAAVAAKSKGYTNIRVYTTGRAAWVEASLPTYSSRDFIENGNVLVIDTRARQASVAGRIKGAFNLPIDALKTGLRDLPRDAPIVLYGDNDTEAVELLTDAEFTTITLVEGGYPGWIKAGGKIEKGPITAAAIKWERKLAKGEVSLADFRKAVTGESKNVLLVDVRGQDEIGNQKMIANAINIPLDELPARKAALPKDDMIYFYCATGARAQMAYNALANTGLHVKFLRMNLKELVLALQTEPLHGKSALKLPVAARR